MATHSEIPAEAIRDGAATPLGRAIRDDDGDVMFSIAAPSGGIHDHQFRVKRIRWPSGRDSFYLEFAEPGACQCVRRVDLAMLTHAVMNIGDAELRSLEDRETCASCGHKHHLDDTQIVSSNGV